MARMRWGARTRCLLLLTAAHIAAAGLEECASGLQGDVLGKDESIRECALGANGDAMEPSGLGRHLAAAAAGAHHMADPALTSALATAAGASDASLTSTLSAPNGRLAIRKASVMYGMDGELMSSTGRLSDWSWAGYQMGEENIPDKPATLDLKKDFGAKGDGKTIDTNAFIQAFAKAPAGAILYLPPGRYVLDKQITRKSPLVMRGAGRDLTTIYMPKSLSEIIAPWNTSDKSTLSPYRDGPFMITFQGYWTANAATRIANVSVDAQRGDSSIIVTMEATASLQPGQFVRIVGTDRNYSLVSYLYGQTRKQWDTTDIRDASSLRNMRLLTFTTPIKGWTRMEAPKGVNLFRLQLLRPLAFNLRPLDWDAVSVHVVSSTVMESGVEDITFEFPPSLYLGHFREWGYNALSFMACINCWARRLRFINHDYGLQCNAGGLTTIDDLIFTYNTDRSKGNTAKAWGHHHITLTRVTDHLAKNIYVTHKAMHDVTFDHEASLNVYHNVSAPDLTMDFHSSAPTFNLLSHMSCGLCSAPWTSGGSSTSGAHAGIGNTVWGVSMTNKAGKVEPPWYNFGVDFTVVGMQLSRVVTYNQFMSEPIDVNTLWPLDLHGTMYLRRQYAGNLWTRAKSTLLPGPTKSTGALPPSTPVYVARPAGSPEAPAPDMPATPGEDSASENALES